MPQLTDATPSFLGYLFQGQFALLALWDCSDDYSVSIETDDDVVLDGTQTRLIQLKHSLGTPPLLTVANVGFWKSMGIWIQYAEKELAGRTESDDSGRSQYLFVTVADISVGDPLESLAGGRARSDSTNQEVIKRLTEEAQRVTDERQELAGAHQPRAAGCEAFLRLSAQKRIEFVARVSVLANSFKMTDVPSEVAKRLSTVLIAKQRPAAIERLLERWDRQVALALLGKRNRTIVRQELTSLVQEVILEIGPNSLPDDYGHREPNADEMARGVGSIVEQQISLVRGGAMRIERALRDRWRARNQREAWMSEDASLVPILKNHDDALKEAWKDTHGPMCHDSRGGTEDDLSRYGLKVLDWAYNDAPTVVPSPRTQWTKPFYARGMLQQFADDLEVGWHPNYYEHFSPPVQPPPDTLDSAERERAEEVSEHSEKFRDILPSLNIHVKASADLVVPVVPKKMRTRKQVVVE